MHFTLIHLLFFIFSYKKLQSPLLSCFLVYFKKQSLFIVFYLLFTIFFAFSHVAKRDKITLITQNHLLFLFFYTKHVKKEIVKNTNKKYLFEVFIKNKYKIVIKTKKINQNL